MKKRSMYSQKPAAIVTKFAIGQQRKYWPIDPGLQNRLQSGFALMKKAKLHNDVIYIHEPGKLYDAEHKNPLTGGTIPYRSFCHW